ncbi:ubiquitin-like-specific protease ESD4 [Triticum aestivum]|uniref:ubiquitin-like-specific protease ESD4 n=1 Tax=Triticum aestivum TaxID=4565 RepID=UPI001D015115|nr:ubiquitin-like-specific protease ESD4 [Triticum aestivum]
MSLYCYIIVFVLLSLHVIIAIVTDYACSGDDWSVIENIRSEPSKERNLVSIGDAFLKKRHLLSLLTPGEWVGDEVINTYINCMTAMEHLQVRSGGSVFLENACISKMIKIGSYLPSDDMDVAPAWVLNRAKAYLENDMVYFPINMEDVHWYLCVINAIKKCVQVLDSLGPYMSRKDLTDTVCTSSYCPIFSKKLFFLISHL